jgi:hypothetical protein
MPAAGTHFRSTGLAPNAVAVVVQTVSIRSYDLDGPRVDRTGGRPFELAVGVLRAAEAIVSEFGHAFGAQRRVLRIHTAEE